MSTDAPKPPLQGVIVAYSRVDAVGRIRIEDGTEIRFGVGAMPGVVPVEGAEVRITEITPHPLGGWRAKRVEVAAHARARHQQLLARAEAEVKEQARQWPLPVAAIGPSAVREISQSNADRAREWSRSQRRRQFDALASRPRSAEEARIWCAQRLPGDFVHVADTATMVTRFAAFAGEDGPSRIGGHPNLSPHVEWPRHRGAPLSFVLQLDLAELAMTDPDSMLPSRGRLLFFYDTENESPPDPGNAGACQIIHDLGEAATIQHPPDGAPHGSPSPSRIRFYRAAYLPNFEHREETLDWELDSELDPLETRHQLLGEAYCHPDRSRMLDGNDPREWRLLLQVDGDEVADIGWSHGGRLLVWIRADALARGDFTAVCAIVDDG